MQIKATIITPIMPNFIQYMIQGVLSEKTIAVESLSAEEAKEYAALMAETFMQHWSSKKQKNIYPSGAIKS